jgi:hypothetical protein
LPVSLGKTRSRLPLRRSQAGTLETAPPLRVSDGFTDRRSQVPKNPLNPNIDTMRVWEVLSPSIGPLCGLPLRIHNYLLAYPSVWMGPRGG